MSIYGHAFLLLAGVALFAFCLYQCNGLKDVKPEGTAEVDAAGLYALTLFVFFCIAISIIWTQCEAVAALL